MGLCLGTIKGKEVPLAPMTWTQFTYHNDERTDHYKANED